MNSGSCSQMRSSCKCPITGILKFPETRTSTKRTPKFSEYFPFPFNFGPEISKVLAEWKAPLMKNLQESVFIKKCIFKIHICPVQRLIIFLS